MLIGFLRWSQGCGVGFSGSDRRVENTRCRFCLCNLVHIFADEPFNSALRDRFQDFPHLANEITPCYPLITQVGRYCSCLNWNQLLLSALERFLRGPVVVINTTWPYHKIMIRGVNITVLSLHSPGVHDFIVDGGAVLQSQLIKLKVQPNCFQADLCIECEAAKVNRPANTKACA